MGCEVTSVIGFRSKDLLILEDEFKAASDRLFVMTDDGSYGRHGNVCVPLNEMFANGEKFDEVITIGPLIMMKFVVAAVKPTGIPCTVSMNPIMIDGTRHVRRLPASPCTGTASALQSSHVLTAPTSTAMKLILTKQ